MYKIHLLLDSLPPRVPSVSMLLAELVLATARNLFIRDSGTTTRLFSPSRPNTAGFVDLMQAEHF